MRKRKIAHSEVRSEDPVSESWYAPTGTFPSEVLPTKAAPLIY
jgi:hypothetical protein